MRWLVAIALFVVFWLTSVAIGFIGPQMMVGQDAAGALWPQIMGIVGAVIAGPALGSAAAYAWLSKTRATSTMNAR